MRKRLTWIAPAAVACAVLSISLAGAAQAGKPLSASPVKGKAGPAHVLAGQKLTANLLVPNGFSGATVGSGFAAVDAPATLNCKKVNCTIEAIMMVQFASGVGGETPGPWAICLNVDGNYNTCPFMDDGANNGFFTGATATGYLAALAKGPHTVQTFLYTGNGTTIYNYDIAYHAYG